MMKFVNATWKIKGGKVSKYNDRFLVLYNSKKKLSKRPSYFEIVETLLKLEGLLKNEDTVY